MEDSILIEKYKTDGDLLHLAHLYKKYMHLVYGACLKYLKNEADAEDAVMDIYEKLSKKIKTSEIQNFKSWLYTVTRNHCFEILRRQKTRFVKENDAAVMYSGRVFHPDDIDQEEDIKILKMCIDRLESLQKASIEMFYFNKMTYVEVAQQLGLRYNQVRSRIQNGRRNLKLCMEKNKPARG